MARTGDQAFIKEMNRSIVLQVLRSRGAISRTDIAHVTGLNKATVSSLIEELIQQRLVMEVGRGSSQVGRRPILLMFNATAGLVFGVELEVNFAHLVVTDLSGEIVHRFDFEYEDASNSQAVIIQLAEHIKQIQKKLPATPLGTIGIGIGVPALVDFKRGIVLNAPNLGWENVHLKALLEGHLDIPVHIDNEANTGALGEKLRGAGRDISDLIYISAGVGLGTGIIVNNELLHGAQGVSGEFGHMTIDPRGIRCSCGNQGCWEMYASEKALINRYHQISGDMLTSEQILSLARSANPHALQALQFVSSNLGIGLSNILNGLNPSLVLIGNRLSEAGDQLLGVVLQTLKARCFIAPYAPVNVQISTLGRDACTVGAASLVLHEYFATPMGSADVLARA